jgi:hypothetical protein
MNDLVPSDITAVAAPSSPRVPTFNYGTLDANLADDARAIATRIKLRLKNSYLATGQDLIAMKERLGHGQFGAWVAAEFGLTARTAERYMGAARIQAANSDIVSHLAPGMMEALAAPSLPEAVRAVCIERIKAGVTMSPRQVKECAAAVRDQEARDKRAERELPRGKKARKEALAERERAAQRRQAEDQRAMNDRAALVGMIVNALGERQVDALRLMKRLTRWDIDGELLEALERQAGNQ